MSKPQIQIICMYIIQESHINSKFLFALRELSGNGINNGCVGYSCVIYHMVKLLWMLQENLNCFVASYNLILTKKINIFSILIRHMKKKQNTIKYPWKLISFCIRAKTGKNSHCLITISVL